MWEERSNINHFSSFTVEIFWNPLPLSTPQNSCIYYCPEWQQKFIPSCSNAENKSIYISWALFLKSGKEKVGQDMFSDQQIRVCAVAII